MLGVKAEVGRTLQASDDRRSAEYHVAVATHQFWRDRYALDPNALGQTVRVGSVAFALVGFLPDPARSSSRWRSRCRWSL